MIGINENFLKLRAGYLFPEIGRRVRAFKQEHPSAKVISMGIGDVTQPLAAGGDRGHAPGRGRDGPAGDLPGL